MKVVRIWFIYLKKCLLATMISKSFHVGTVQLGYVTPRLKKMHSSS
jgi:hypothetical protein